MPTHRVRPDLPVTASWKRFSSWFPFSHSISLSPSVTPSSCLPSAVFVSLSPPTALFPSGPRRAPAQTPEPEQDPRPQPSQAMPDVTFPKFYFVSNISPPPLRAGVFVSFAVALFLGRVFASRLEGLSLPLCGGEVRAESGAGGTEPGDVPPELSVGWVTNVRKI